MYLAQAPKYHRFPASVISHAIWRYHRFNDSYRDIAEELAYRGHRQVNESRAQKGVILEF